VTEVMKGVRVLEVAEYAMVPSAGAVLADWGADVIKVEHAERGDAIRGLTAWKIAPGTGGFTFMWEPFNRGKRSIGIDITVPAGRDIVLELVRKADVFITNFLPPARAKLGIDVTDIQAANPRIIYGRGSAFGQKGSESNRGGFDGTAYWLRSGLGAACMPEGSTDLVTLPGPAIGDIQTGMALAGGLAAALFHRERTGEGTVVDVSLMSAGIWAMQSSLVAANISGQKELPHSNQRSAPNPLYNPYKTSDGRFIVLVMLQGDTYWQEFCEAIGRPDMIGDPRFASLEARAGNNEACIRELGAVFAAKPLEEWSEILSRQRGQWGVVQIVTDLNEDRQAWENGYLQKVDYGDGRILTLATAPVQFDGAAPVLRPAPSHAVDTDEVMLELGLDWDRIIELKTLGAIS
jgi:crotonobetainyl-CoA:carnitine CoA-transferase CaiB-like acyl-CoA transferase